MLLDNNDCVIVVYFSGYYHQIVNSLDKDGYETELKVALRSASRLIIKDLSTCIAMGGPEIMLQSHNSRLILTLSLPIPLRLYTLP